MARILDVAQHGGDGHDGQPDPEEVEEAMEIAVVARRVKVGYARGELDGWEDAPLLRRARLLARRREGLDGRGRILRDGRRAAAGVGGRS